MEVKEHIGRRGHAVMKPMLRVLTFRMAPYQPVLVSGKVVAAGRRDVEGRAEAVLKIAADVDARTAVDLGCAEGYFVRRLVEDGRRAIGVDSHTRRLLAAQWSMALDRLDGYGFIKSWVDLDTLKLLPDADLMLCSSLVHHLMYEHGEDYAREFMSTLRGKTGKALVFEMGQSNEPAFKWSSHLPDMGDDPHGWIARFLESAGFRDVEKVCEAPSFNSDVRRATFFARP